MTLLDYAIAVAAVGFGAVAQGSLGFGLGMLAAPVLALVDERLVPGPLLLVGVVVTSTVAWRERGHLDWKGIRWALVGRVAGTLIGLAVLSRLDGDGLGLVLGVFILVAVALSLMGRQLRPTSVTLLGAGTMSGVMGMLTSIGGPPMALVYQREEAARLRSTLAGFFCFGATLAIVALIAGGEFGLRELGDGVALLPGLALGLTVSGALRPHLDRGWTRPAVLALSTAAALVLVIDSFG